MKARGAFGLAYWLVLAATAGSAEYRVEELNEGPPSSGVSPAVAEQLQTEGLRIIRGAQATYCDVWLAKNPEADGEFKPTAEVNYPFRSGQLLGLVRFARTGSDFRDQRLASGVYTLRYGLQPIDGNHVGTFPTRDFLLLLRAADDESPAVIADVDALSRRSGEAADASHPAMFPMLKAPDSAPATPAMQHNEEKDWWIVEGRITINAGGQEKELPLAVVVAGVAEE